MSSLATATILNVDDTEAARYAKSRTLQHAGFEVVDARTGAEALQQMEVLRPALVLLDVRLPDISGIEVCKTIKQRWPATVVLQTSATFVSSSDRVRGLEGGADSYLIQPIEADELVAAVRALLRLYSAEEKTRQLNETLERRIRERTHELHQTNARLMEQIAQRERAEAALVQSQKMEAVGQLTGSMAHDFNNILASMTGYLAVARVKSKELEVKALLEKALAASERGKRLTMRLLTFSRSDSLVTQAVDVRALISGMEDWLRQTAGSGIRIDYEHEAGELIALTDANQLELAVLNLVINARDAMPRGGELSIKLSSQRLFEADADLAAGDYVVLSVIDSGVGMSSDVAAHAFDPFFTTKPAGRGTGLGLAQVFNVGRLSRGSARVSSRPNAGTRVDVWLAAGSGTDVQISPADEVDLRGRGERILVVDDEADIRRSVVQLLQGNGYEAVEVGTGEEALASIQASVPDLLLIDFAMPGMSGVDLARRVLEQDPAMPVVFISGHVERAALNAAVPGVKLLRKPFRSESLYYELRQALK